MALTIVTGRAKSGKSKYIYDRIKELSQNGEEVMLIVPEQYSYAAEKKLLNIVDAIKDNSVEVFSFGRLATETDKRLGFAYLEKIDAVGKVLTHQPAQRRFSGTAGQHAEPRLPVGP